MANGTFTVDIQNSSIGASNIASMSFRVFQPDRTVAQAAADVLAVVLKGGEACFAGGTAVVSCRYRQAGQNASVNVLFPVAEYAAKKLATIATTLVTETGYGRATGAGPLAPLGTSICVTEYTDKEGRTGRGRHFWPFVSTSAVDAFGQYTLPLTTDLTYLINALYGLGSNGAPSLFGFGVGENIINSIKVRRVFSNLRSRRR